MTYGQSTVLNCMPHDENTKSSLKFLLFFFPALKKRRRRVRVVSSVEIQALDLPYKPILNGPLVEMERKLDSFDLSNALKLVGPKKKKGSALKPRDNQ